MKTIHRRGLDSQAVVLRYSLKSGALKNFTNFTGKQLLELFFNKIAGLQARGVQLFSKETPWRSPWSLQRRCFPVKFAKSARIPFCTKQFSWLLLYINLKDCVCFTLRTL